MKYKFYYGVVAIFIIFAFGWATNAMVAYDANIGRQRKQAEEQFKIELIKRIEAMPENTTAIILCGSSRAYDKLNEYLSRGFRVIGKEQPIPGYLDGVARYTITNAAEEE